MNKLWIAIGVVVTTAWGWSAAITNLDFESATYTGSMFNDRVPVTEALPGWTVRAGTFVESLVQYGAQTLDGGSLVELVSTYASNTTIAGHYDVLLRNGVYGARPISLSQTGDVPADAWSLRFLARGVTDVNEGGTSSGVLSLLVNGESVPLIKQSQAGINASFAADISAWAGQSAELRFVVTGGQITTNNPSGFGFAELDNIVFSPTAVPEPATAAAGTLGVALLRRRRQIV